MPHDGISSLFFRHKIGIIFVKSENGNVEFYAKIPSSNASGVKQYFLWSTQNTVGPKGHRGIGLSDALAKRVGKDNFKLLWSKKEMAEFYESCFPQLSPRQTLMKKEIMMGHKLPADIIMKATGY